MNYRLLNAISALVLALMLVFLFSSTHVKASELPASDASLNISDYTLPYPGLLPDHPIYPLKVTRDKIVGLLIGNLIKKAEFDLLQSNKRMSASQMLVKNKNKPLIISTISKSQNYYEQAVNSLATAKKQGLPISDISLELTRAGYKHILVIDAIEAELKEQKSDDFKVLKSRMAKLTARALLLKNG